jgi:hypothetical protein
MPNACLLNQRRLAGCRNGYLWLRVVSGRQRAANRYRRRYASDLEQGRLIEAHQRVYKLLKKRKSASSRFNAMESWVCHGCGH